LPPLLEQLGEVHAVALAAGERADLLLLVGALEVEPRHVGARVDLALADLDLVVPPVISSQTSCRVERVAALVDVGELHRLADRACRRRASPGR
jgi:hypothetical protein